MFTLQHATSAEQAGRAYEELYSRHWLLTRAALFDWLMRQLQPLPGRTLLDVACGDAQLGPIARRKGLLYCGIDISQIAVRSARDKWVMVGDGTRLPIADNGFDYVMSVGSLEHYLDLAQGVREIMRTLKPSGRACILVPNAFSLTWNVLRVWRTGDLADDGQPIQRFATRGAWQRLLDENGLVIIRTLGYERAWPQARAEWQPYGTLPGELALALLAPFLPLNLKRCFVFLCTKKPGSAANPPI